MAVKTFTPDDAVSRRGIELLSSGNLTDFGNLNVTVWSYVDTITFSFYMRKGALPDTEQIPRRCCEVVEELCTDFVPKTTAGGGS